MSEIGEGKYRTELHGGKLLKKPRAAAAAVDDDNEIKTTVNKYYSNILLEPNASSVHPLKLPAPISSNAMFINMVRLYF